MIGFTRSLLFGMFVLVVVAGCEEQAPADPEPQAAPAPGEGEAAAPVGAADQEPEDLGPSVATDTYELRAEAAGPYAAGELGQFQVTLAGKGEWHVNQDYPTSVTIAGAEGVELAKQTLEKADAAEFREEGARFDVPFTAEEVGEHRVQADVSFAICTEETCVPQRKSLALLLPVE
ncbi:MAG: hypothetical protein ACODAU_05160 [Myxococcota bacterium]